MASEYKFTTILDYKVNSKEAYNEMLKIQDAWSAIGKLTNEDRELVSKYADSYEQVTKKIEEIQKKNEALKKTEEAIVNVKRRMNQVDSSSKEYKNLENMLRLMRQKRQEIQNDPELKNTYDRIKAKELELKQMDEAREKQLETNSYVKELRDNLRKKGIGFYVPNFNATFDKIIGRNDEKIAKNEGEMFEIDKKLAITEDEGEREKLAKRKQELKIDTDAKKSSNAKMAIAQTAMNTAINGVKKFGNMANMVFKTMGIDLKSVFKDVISTIASELKETGIASYNTGSTLFTNATAREQQMKYGLSNSSNYALTKTMEMLNMKSDDDLVYMNETQKEAFNSLLDRYKGWYEQLESTGAMVKLQQAQLEFKMFKQELSMKLLNWFADHKEAIFTLLEVAMNVLEFIAQAVEGILSIFGKSTTSSRNALGNSDTYLSNTNSNININVNNTNNASANLNSKAELDSSLTSANSNLVKQIASSLSSR